MHARWGSARAVTCVAWGERVCRESCVSPAALGRGAKAKMHPHATRGRLSGDKAFWLAASLFHCSELRPSTAVFPWTEAPGAAGQARRPRRQLKREQPRKPPIRHEPDIHGSMIDWVLGNPEHSAAYVILDMKVCAGRDVRFRKLHHTFRISS